MTGISASFTDAAAAEDRATETEDTEEDESDDRTDFALSFCAAESVGGASVWTLIDMDHLHGAIVL